MTRDSFGGLRPWPRMDRDRDFLSEDRGDRGEGRTGSRFKHRESTEERENLNPTADNSGLHRLCRVGHRDAEFVIVGGPQDEFDAFELIAAAEGDRLMVILEAARHLNEFGFADVGFDEH